MSFKKNMNGRLKSEYVVEKWLSSEILFRTTRIQVSYSWPLLMTMTNSALYIDLLLFKKKGIALSYFSGLKNSGQKISPFKSEVQV